MEIASQAPFESIHHDSCTTVTRFCFCALCKRARSSICNKKKNVNILKKNAAPPFRENAVCFVVAWSRFAKKNIQKKTVAVGIFFFVSYSVCICCRAMSACDVHTKYVSACYMLKTGFATLFYSPYSIYGTASYSSRTRNYHINNTSWCSRGILFREC